MVQRMTIGLALVFCACLSQLTVADEPSASADIALGEEQPAGLDSSPATTELGEEAAEPGAETVLQPFTSPKSAPPAWSLDIGYLLWGLDDVYLPAVATSNPAGTPLADVGRLEAPSTRISVGDDNVGDAPQSGLRGRVARTLSGGRRFELSGWLLFQRGDDWSLASVAGSPILSRPFVDATTGLPDAQVLSMPGIAEGSLTASYERRAMSIEPLVFSCLHGDGCDWWEGFVGYRFLRHEDEFRIAERVAPVPGGRIAPGTEFNVSDSFRAANDYHLIPLGINYTRSRQRWQLNLRGAVGLGFMRQEVEIAGQTEIAVAGAPSQTYDAGLLALSSNAGSHERYRFAWVPQLDLQLQRTLANGWAAHVGYTILYLNEVARAPDHIDTTVDPNLVPPPLVGSGPRPAFRFRSHGELLHGLSVGIRRDF